MTCTKCGQDNPPEARFCGSCGTALAAAAAAGEERLGQYVTCPMCGQDNLAGTRVCTKCRWVLVVAPDGKRLIEKRAFRYWAYPGFAIGIILIVVVIVSSDYGLLWLLPNPLWWLVPVAFGACLWVVVTGNWPGTQNEVDGEVRVILALVVIAANGIVGLLSWFLAAWSGADLALGIGLLVFVAAAVVEVTSLLLVVGIVKLILHLWRRARNASASGGKAGQSAHPEPVEGYERGRGGPNAR